MLNVDLIVPRLTKFQRVTRIPKAGNTKYRYWFPVWYYKNDLKKMGVNIRFKSLFHMKHNKLAKIVGIDSRIIEDINLESIISRLKKYANFIIWFDVNTSSRKITFPALKYVDRFFTRKLLKDRSLYQKKMHKSSVFVDYYKNNYNPKGSKTGPGGYILNSKYENKIGIAWNLALCDYRYSGKFSEYLCKFSRNKKLKFSKPSSVRKYLFSANFNIVKSSNVIYFQREKLGKFLYKNYFSNSNVSIGRIPSKDYLNTQISSKAIFSPFGWGEMCYRDFEVFLAGAALIKPNMDHLETWPDIYKNNETYIPISWKIEDWDEEIPAILADKENLLNIAKKGQMEYRKVWSKEGKRLFCERFINMVTPN